MSIEEAIKEFEFDCKVRKLSVRTISNYTKQLKYLTRYLKSEFDITEVENVKPYHIKQFLAMMDDRGRKPRYINDLLKVFRTFFNYLTREGHITTQPTDNVRNMKMPKLKLITFTEADIRHMLNYYSGRDFLSIRNRSMLAMFFDTGMRLSEVINLKAEQIHDDYIASSERRQAFVHHHGKLVLCRFHQQAGFTGPG